MPARVCIEDISPEIVREVRYLNAARGGGTEVARLPIVRAMVGPLAEELDAIIACSDLQGIVRGPGGAAELLGVEVAAILEELAFDGVLPLAARTGVLLAGDLFSVPDANRRGGFGGVADVWRAFAERFAWVAGVAGNHDDIDGVAELARRGAPVHLLDGEVVEVDGIRLGGVGRVIGSKPKPGRRLPAEQLALIERVIDDAPDVLVLHEGPAGSDDQPGNAEIRSLVEVGEVGLTICGHVHWGEPLATHGRGQILNVDTRIVVLVASPG